MPKLFVKNNYYKSSSQKGLNNHNIRKSFQDNASTLDETERRNQNVYYENYSKTFQDFNELLDLQYEIQEKKKFFQSEETKKKNNTLMTQVLVLPQETITNLLNENPHNYNLVIKSIEDYLKLLEKEYGLKCSSFHLHMDEGHYDKNDNNKIILNTHAHFEFLNFDFINERTIMRRLKKEDFSHMQDLAANAFQENGIDIKRGTKSVNSKNKNLSVEAFVAEKINAMNSDLEFIEINFSLDNLEQITLEEIQEQKVRFKDNKLMKRYFDYFYKIKNKQLQGKDYSKDIERLEKTVLKLSNEEKALLDSITIKTQENQHLDNFKDWVEVPNRYVEKIELVEKDQKLRKALAIIEDLKTLIEETTVAAEEKLKIVRNEVNIKKAELKNEIDYQEKMNSKYFTTLTEQDQRSLKDVRRDFKNLLNQNNKHILVHGVWQQAAKDRGLLSYFKSVEDKLKPQINKRLEEIKDQYDMDSNINIIKDIDLNDID